VILNLHSFYKIQNYGFFRYQQTLNKVYMCFLYLFCIWCDLSKETSRFLYIGHRL